MAVNTFFIKLKKKTVWDVVQLQFATLFNYCFHLRIIGILDIRRNQEVLSTDVCCLVIVEITISWKVRRITIKASHQGGFFSAINLQRVVIHSWTQLSIYCLPSRRRGLVACVYPLWAQTSTGEGTSATLQSEREGCKPEHGVRHLTGCCTSSTCSYLPQPSAENTVKTQVGSSRRRTSAATIPVYVVRGNFWTASAPTRAENWIRLPWKRPVSRRDLLHHIRTMIFWRSCHAADMSRHVHWFHTRAHAYTHT